MGFHWLPRRFPRQNSLENPYSTDSTDATGHITRASNAYVSEYHVRARACVMAWHPWNQCWRGFSRHMPWKLAWKLAWNAGHLSAPMASSKAKYPIVSHSALLCVSLLMNCPALPGASFQLASMASSLGTTILRDT